MKSVAYSNLEGVSTTIHWKIEISTDIIIESPSSCAEHLLLL